MEAQNKLEMIWNRKTALSRAWILVGVAWILQGIFLLPIDVLADTLHDPENPLFNDPFTGSAIAALVFYSLLFGPCALVIFAGRFLSQQLGERYRAIQYCQPVAIIVLFEILQDPPRGSLCLGFAFAAYATVFISRLLVRWLKDEGGRAKGAMPKRNRVLLRCLLLVLAAWFLQVILLFPAAIFAAGILDNRFPFVTVPVTGAINTILIFYSLLLVPCVLIILAGNVLATQVSSRLKFVEYLQPSLLLLVVTFFGGPGVVEVGIICIFCAFGTVFVLRWLERWLTAPAGHWRKEHRDRNGAAL